MATNINSDDVEIHLGFIRDVRDVWDELEAIEDDLSNVETGDVVMGVDGYVRVFDSPPDPTMPAVHLKNVGTGRGFNVQEQTRQFTTVYYHAPDRVFEPVESRR